MQLSWDEHFLEIVIPSWQAYLSAEDQLTRALNAGDDISASRTRYTALREAGAASFYMHHYAEIVLRARPHWLSSDIHGLEALRGLVADHCTALRSEILTGDVSLLHNVADALKHAILTRNPERRMVAANEAVLVSAAGYGGGHCGEGKFGGAEQVLVLSRDGERALSGILQNVVDAWRRVAGMQLPQIGEP